MFIRHSVHTWVGGRTPSRPSYIQIFPSIVTHLGTTASLLILTTILLNIYEKKVFLSVLIALTSESCIWMIYIEIYIRICIYSKRSKNLCARQIYTYKKYSWLSIGWIFFLIIKIRHLTNFWRCFFFWKKIFVSFYFLWFLIIWEKRPSRQFICTYRRIYKIFIIRISTSQKIIY